MASIQKRTWRKSIVDGSGNERKVEVARYRARYRDRSGKEHARHFERKVDAQRWLDEVTASVVTGTYVDPKAGRITFDEWFEKWSAGQLWADGTLTSARQAAASVPFGKVPIGKIDEGDVQAWIKSLHTRLAVSTIHTRFNYVHMAFLAAVRKRLIAVDPCADVKLPRKRKIESTMLIPTSEQVARALREAPESFVAFIGVCAFAGLRLGEAAGLQVRDVNFLGKTLTVDRQVQGTNVANTKVVPPKYESGRTIPIPDGLVTMLSEHIRLVGTFGDDDWLFTDGVGLMNRSSAGHQWRRLRKQVGLDEFTLHSLRHFYASGLIASGCDVVTVQKALGHSKSSITLDVYSHLWPNGAERTRAAAATLMSSVLAGPADSLRTESLNQAADLRG